MLASARLPSTLRPSSSDGTVAASRQTDFTDKAFLQKTSHECPDIKNGVVRISKPFFLWVSTICINQNDNQEMAHQIHFMAAIYAKAYRVIVWLGDAQNESDEATRANTDSMRRVSGPFGPVSTSDFTAAQAAMVLPDLGKATNRVTLPELTKF